MRGAALISLLAVCHAQTFFNNDEYHQTKGGSSYCPDGYQPIEDEKACKNVAEQISQKNFGAVYHYYPVNSFPKFCTTKNDDVNYYVNPESVHTDVQVSILCVNSSLTCDVSDGSGESSSYPCVCGTDTCAKGEVCRAADNMCEVIKGYVETERKANSCPIGYQRILDEAACQEVAEKIPDKRWGAVYTFITVPYGCSSWTTDIVNYYVNPDGPITDNPAGTNTDVDVAMLCISTSLACDVTDGSGMSSSYPCVCGTDTCATGEVCNAATGVCEVIAGYYEAERKADSCAPGYQVITDQDACEQLAGMLPGKTWGATYHFSNIVHGCVTQLSDTVDYYVNPGGTNRDVEVSLLCISNSSLVCDVSDGSGVSSSYPCTCGTDTCTSGEFCNATMNLCEVIEGYYETERMANECPSGYQVISDEAACREVAGKLDRRNWGATYHYSTVVHGCVTDLFDTVDYYVNPNFTGTNTDVNVAMLCIRSSMTCDVSDGSNVSSFYPCACGTDTCATGEVCSADNDLCEVIKGYYETERMASECPSGYQVITDAGACEELAQRISSRNLGGISDRYWGGVLADLKAPYGCATHLFDRVNYYVDERGYDVPPNVNVAMLCIKSSMECSILDGSDVSSEYPCTCGTDTCMTGEVCRRSANTCEIVKGFYQTERRTSSCPTGYQVIGSEAACRTLADKIQSRNWGSVYAPSTVASGCGTWMFDTVNYYVNPGGESTDVDVGMLCASDGTS